MQGFVAVGLVVAVLILVIWQPRGLSIGWPAAIGAVVAVAFGIVPVAAVSTVLRIVWNPTLTFVALVLLSLVLDAVGVFRWAALHVVRAAGGSGTRLFLYSLLLGAAVAGLFANDGAALILTPIIYEQVRALRVPRPTVLAFVMAGGFIADATSLPLVISNLTNILSADYFHVTFSTYAAHMIPVDIAALAASTAVLFLYYRRAVPRRLPDHPLPEPAQAIVDPRLFRLALPTLVVMMAGYLASGPLHLPVSVVTGAVALWLLALAARTPALDVRRAVRAAPWRIVVFSAGMYLVVFGLRDAGLVADLSRILNWGAAHGLGSAIMVTGLTIGLLSAVMNNLPSVLVGTLAIHGAAIGSGHLRLAMVLANIVGSDLGPKLTPIGSLATLLWLHILEARGLRIGWGYYCRVGIVLTLPVLLATLGALWLIMGRT